MAAAVVGTAGCSVDISVSVNLQTEAGAGCSSRGGGQTAVVHVQSSSGEPPQASRLLILVPECLTGADLGARYSVFVLAESLHGVSPSTRTGNGRTHRLGDHLRVRVHTRGNGCGILCCIIKVKLLNGWRLL